MTRFLIVNTDYPGFLESLYSAHSGLEDESYDRQLAVRNASLFGVSDFYPRNLVDLGHPAIEVSIASLDASHLFKTATSPRPSLRR